MSKRTTAPQQSRSNRPRTALLGVGDAAVKFLYRLKPTIFARSPRIAVNTFECLPPHPEQPPGFQTVIIGAPRENCSGLGGEPECARQAAEAAEAQFRSLFEKTDLVLLVAGLGRGTGSGATPVIARLARECGSRVLAVVSHPYDFEGPLRAEITATALRQLRANAEGVISLPNQQLARTIDAESIGPANFFSASQQAFLEVFQAVDQLLHADNFLEISLNDLFSLFGRGREEARCVTAEASGEEATRKIVEQFLKNPMSETGKAFEESGSMLVYLLGDASINMAQINDLMERLYQVCPNSRCVLGAGHTGRNDGVLHAAVFFTRGGGVGRGSEDNGAEIVAHAFKAHLEPDAPGHSASVFSPPPPSILSPEKQQEILNQQRKQGKSLQFDLPLEVVSRGRFEKSERTIHRGQDLDIPTFIRKGIAL